MWWSWWWWWWWWWRLHFTQSRCQWFVQYQTFKWHYHRRIEHTIVFNQQQSIICLLCSSARVQQCVQRMHVCGHRMNHWINNINYGLHSIQHEIYGLLCYSAGEIIIKLYIGGTTCISHLSCFPHNQQIRVFMRLYTVSCLPLIFFCLFCVPISRWHT